MRAVFIRNQVDEHCHTTGAMISDADGEAFGRATVELMRADLPRVRSRAEPQARNGLRLWLPKGRTRTAAARGVMRDA